MMDAICKIEETLNAFELPDQLIIAGKCVLGILLELRHMGEQDADRQPDFDVICSDVQAWLRRHIETFRFQKSQ